MHSLLDSRPVQIITGHVTYNSTYKYWPAENGHAWPMSHSFQKPSDPAYYIED